MFWFSFDGKMVENGGKIGGFGALLVATSKFWVSFDGKTGVTYRAPLPYGDCTSEVIRLYGLGSLTWKLRNLC